MQFVGIIPDIPVALDPTNRTEVLRLLDQGKVINYSVVLSLLNFVIKWQSQQSTGLAMTTADFVSLTVIICFFLNCETSLLYSMFY